MTILRKVTTVMTGVAGAPFVNTLYFTYVAGQATAIQAAVTEAWSDLSTVTHTNLEGTVEPEQVLINDATGLATGTEVALGTGAFGGNNANEPAPAATQGLCRARTGVYVGGRELRGRVFIPAVTEDSGNAVPSTGYQTTVTGAFADLIGDTAAIGEWRIFSRKNLTSAVVTSATAWSQYAVLRSRRQ